MFVLLAAVLLVALWYDSRDNRIPNWLVTAGVAAALITKAMLPETGGVGGAAAGLLAGLAVMLPAYALNAAGAGDVKLMAVVGALTAPLDAVAIGLASAMLGGVMGSVCLTGAHLRAAGGARPVIAPLPYTYAIAGGTACWFLIKTAH